MRQADLDRAVARATGESVNMIRRCGFSFVPARRRNRPRRNAGVTAATTPPKSVVAYARAA